MIFAKLDVTMWGHEKFVAAGPAAVGYWAAALAYLREHTSSDGYLKPHVLGLLLGLGEREARKLCDRLVEVGLFAAKDGGYVLLGYATKNETREQIEARREATRGRVSAYRKRVGNEHGNGDCNTVTEVASNTIGNADCNGAVPGSGSGSGSFSVSDRGEPERGSGVQPVLPERRRAAVNATDDGAGGLAVSAWQDGVREATGKPLTLQRGPMLAIVDALVVHCEDPAKRVGFARAKALEWARTRVEKGWQINPHKFVDWLNSPEKPEPVNPYDSPAVREARARREREQDEAVRNAVPMPVAEVFAALGGKKS